MNTMKYLGALALLLAGLGAPALAQGTIYMCVDAGGRRELTDINKPGCKVLDVPGAIPAPPSFQRRANAREGGAAPVTTPSNFPRVDNYLQRQRDNDRREILNDELRSEEKKLADLKRDFNNGEPERMGNERNYVKYQERVADMRENINRSEKNIEALRREIGSIH